MTKRGIKNRGFRALHHMLPILSFVSILQSCYKRSQHPRNQHIASHVATIFCNHLAKLLQKIIASNKTNTSHDSTNFVIVLQICYKRSSQKYQGISHVTTIFCNHLAKLLQKIVASQKTIASPAVCGGTCNYEMRRTDFKSNLVRTL